MTQIIAVLPTLVAVLLLGGVTVLVLVGSGAPQPFGPGAAIIRGALQLVVISAVLSSVIRDPVLVAAALLVMFTVASVTATRRIGWTGRRYGAVAGTMAAGVP